MVSGEKSLRKIWLLSKYFQGNKDKDNFESDSSEEERVTPSKRQKTDKGKYPKM